MSNTVNESVPRAHRLTATGTIPPLQAIGFHCSVATGTVSISDGAVVIASAFAPNIGFNPFPYIFKTSCVVTITGTIDLTMFGN